MTPFKASQLAQAWRRALALLCAALLLGAGGARAADQQTRRHHQAVTQEKAPPPFIASSAKPFAALMDDAMAVMDYGMKRAPMDGGSEHDFVSMMIPHHQGAIDMAKALLLNTSDPELRNLAQGIITEQQNEINLMQAWLVRYRARQVGAPRQPVTKKD